MILQDEVGCMVRCRCHMFKPWWFGDSPVIKLVLLYPKLSFIWLGGGTLPETNSSPLKIGHPKRKLAFPSSIFRCELLVSGRVFLLSPQMSAQESHDECNCCHQAETNCWLEWKKKMMRMTKGTRTARARFLGDGSRWCVKVRCIDWSKSIQRIG